MSDEITPGDTQPSTQLAVAGALARAGLPPAQRSQAPWKTAREAVLSRSLSPTPKDWLLKRRVPI